MQYALSQIRNAWWYGYRSVVVETKSEWSAWISVHFWLQRRPTDYHITMGYKLSWENTSIRARNRIESPTFEVTTQYNHHGMRRRHAILVVSPACSGHYQDLDISSLTGCNSACNLILSVEGIHKQTNSCVFAGTLAGAVPAPPRVGDCTGCAAHTSQNNSG